MLLGSGAIELLGNGAVYWWSIFAVTWAAAVTEVAAAGSHRGAVDNGASSRPAFLAASLALFASIRFASAIWNVADMAGSVALPVAGGLLGCLPALVALAALVWHDPRPCVLGA